MTREIKIPGPDHPITVEPSPDRVIVRAGGETIADSTATLVLREADYPPVRYIPLTDVDQALARIERHVDLLPVQGRGVLLVGHDRAGPGRRRSVVLR